MSRKMFAAEEFRTAPVEEWPVMLAQLMEQKPEPEKLVLVASVCRDVKVKLLLPTDVQKSIVETTIAALELFAKKGVEERRKRREQLIPYQSRERFRVA